MGSHRHVSDDERTAIIIDQLRQTVRRGNGVGNVDRVLIEEVPSSCGFADNASDALILGTWPSKGHLLHGYEVKASKADLKRELANPTKNERVRRYCDSWTLFAFDQKVIDGLDIPADWGIWLTKKDDHGDIEIDVIREAPKREPKEWPRTFTVSMVRRAAEQSPGAAYLARAVVEARQLAYASARMEKESAVRLALSELLEPLRKAIPTSERWDRRTPQEVVAQAIQALQLNLAVPPPPSTAKEPQGESGT
jgi:hypothetical protein